MSETIRELPATAVPHGAAVTRTRDAEPAEQVEVSVYLKPRAARAGGATARSGRRPAREQLRARRVVEHAADIGAVGAFAAWHGLRVVSAEPGRRRVRLAGSAAEFGAAFRTQLGVYDAGEGEFRSYSGALSVPASLGDRIESVLGLDNRRVARPFLVPQAATDVATSYRPNEVAATNGLPGRAASVNFPASSPGAIGCGGTSITTSGSSITSEVAWNDEDGGTGQFVVPTR